MDSGSSGAPDWETGFFAKLIIFFRLSVGFSVLEQLFIATIST